jgi:CubicO group peptidase (beta-lactamase class C family)
MFSAAEVREVLNQGVREGAFPGAVALWGHPPGPPQLALAGFRGRSRESVPVSPNLAYDLASVTKVLATTSLALIYFQRGRLDLNQPLTAWFLAATPAHLLAHQSGLRPWRPLYRLTAEPAHRRQAALEAIRRDAADPGLSGRPGQATVYSDLNFILLGFLLEAIGGAPLDELFDREVARPLGLAATGYRPGQRPQPPPLAPTEDGFRWGGPIGHPEAAIRGPVPIGCPHDDNAAWLGGVAGHAGLFAPAGDLWALAADWSRAWTTGRGLVFQRPALAEFLRPRPTAQDSGRPLGFNQLKNVAGLAGSALSPTAAGHTGYTGPALWWDYEQNFIWILLTNRVHPRATNPAWRPGLGQAGPINSLFRSNIRPLVEGIF